jgi:rfaE bifunctional protein nucleotidyltransferase chain/domain
VTPKQVFTNGCFDILHLGHIELLEYCSSLGRVTVGLNSDSSIRKLKGESRPVKGQFERQRLLEACRFVDEVVIFDEDTPLDLIKFLKPDIIVKGGDYQADAIIGREYAEVRIFRFVDGYSTTQTIEKINREKV